MGRWDSENCVRKISASFRCRWRKPQKFDKPFSHLPYGWPSALGTRVGLKSTKWEGPEKGGGFGRGPTPWSTVQTWAAGAAGGSSQAW